MQGKVAQVIFCLNFSILHVKLLLKTFNWLYYEKSIKFILIGDSEPKWVNSSLEII